MAEAATQERARRRLLTLAALLSVYEDDAVSLWSRVVGEQRAPLVTAPAFDSLAALPQNAPPVWWNRDTQRYWVGVTHPVDPAAIHAAVLLFLVDAEADARRAAGPLVDDGQAVAEQAAAYAAQTALAVAAVGAGGMEELARLDPKEVASQVAFARERSDAFANDVEMGRMDAAGIVNRAGLYVRAQYPATEIARRYANIAAGFKFEENALDPEADHCEPDPRRPEIPDCPSLTRLGVVPIGTLPLPGKRVCELGCRCTIIYRRTNPEESK
jgi:hypothetical protein